ncbi:MAG TPA: TonB-dependent receptor plug domain-containing protein, partial [Bryobacteraceae bacterium]|nr:TonB-dependent receptor plug domain-containing protein [Bryobacteraceae bacterium]
MLQAPGKLLASAAAALMAGAFGLAGQTAEPQSGPARPAAEQPVIAPVHTSIVITASPTEPAVDRRDSAVFSRTLFGRDDQILHVLGAGINAGQHEGGGKSLEIRRFGFNLDHGGVNGGLKILVDNVQQNQTTQGHGQGYLGSLKSLSPELVQEITLINGPFSPEYGDFSGLGVVHIRLRESLPDKLTTRIQGGSFGTMRGFAGFSPEVRDGDAVLAYEGSYTDGPFDNPLGYRRDNVTASWLRRLSPQNTVGVKLNGGRNDFTSSGQIPVDQVFSGRLSRFGYLDPTQGGRTRNGTLAGYWRHDGTAGEVLKLDGFVSRSLFDLFSNFTYFLNDPEHGDGIRQHDSRLVEG